MDVSTSDMFSLKVEPLKGANSCVWSNIIGSVRQVNGTWKYVYPDCKDTTSVEDKSSTHKSDLALV